MPVYSARVAVPRRTRKTGSNGVPPWIMEEIMVDKITASSQKKAIKKALEQCTGFMSVQFAADERDELPSPSMVAISRLKKDGKPVSGTFNDKALSITIAGDAVFGKERKTTTKQVVKKVVPVAPTMRVVLSDPFTDDIINEVMESNDAKSK